MTIHLEQELWVSCHSMHYYVNFKSVSNDALPFELRKEPRGKPLESTLNVNFLVCLIWLEKITAVVLMQSYQRQFFFLVVFTLPYSIPEVNTCFVFVSYTCILLLSFLASCKWPILVIEMVCWGAIPTN